jgi:hypothetical protein
MKTIYLPLVLLMSAPLFAADPVSAYFDGELKQAEHDVLGLAQAMPADKYNFSPESAGIKGSQFKGVRTFAQQAKHLAATIYQVSSAALGEKPPVDTGTGENGPDSLATKDQIVAYLKGAFAYGHKAIATLNTKNQLDKVKGPFGGEMMRLEAASMVTWHTFDHYGQMVVYARMNGVVPPSSLPAASQPPPPPAAKK